MTDDYKFDVKIERPEEKYNSPFDYFKGDILENYAKSKNMRRIQERIAARALELLNLKSSGVILDAGCGPGFAAFYVEQFGFKLVTIDLISEFLQFYDNREINPVVADMCFPPFRNKVFDGIISISALQWLIKDPIEEVMRENIVQLAKSFEFIVKSRGKMAFQFYPKSDKVIKEIGKVITENTKLSGNFIIDNPNNPKKRKVYLLLNKNNR